MAHIAPRRSMLGTRDNHQRLAEFACPSRAQHVACDLCALTDSPTSKDMCPLKVRTRYSSLPRQGNMEAGRRPRASHMLYASRACPVDVVRVVGTSARSSCTSEKTGAVMRLRAAEILLFLGAGLAQAPSKGAAGPSRARTPEAPRPCAGAGSSCGSPGQPEVWRGSRAALVTGSYQTSPGRCKPVGWLGRAVIAARQAGLQATRHFARVRGRTR